MDASATEDCPIEAGSAITLQWCHTGANCSNPISQSHTGPIMAYMAPLDSNGAGDVWFKIYEEGWDNTTKQWSTDKLIANAGKRDVIIPSYLKAGNYLLRSEIIALHDARVVGGAQFFPNCVQLTVTGNGNIVPTGVAIPGAYGERDPGILYSRSFTDNSGYVIPGPPVYVPDGSNSTTTGNTSSEVQSSSEPSVQSSEPTPSPSSSASAASTPTSTSVASPVNLTPTSSVSKCRPRPTSAKCMKGSGGVARRMAKRTVLPSPTPEQQQQQQRRAEL
ncbi:hypothetical protein LPJ59_002836 [Coemansia sp. RSA 2399]|nr:hypothetical protein LPJ59_002836 [Coemansia sp. RSA 2399]